MAAFLRWVLTKPAVIVVVLVCAVGGGLIGYRTATVQYQTQAAVLVIPPSIPSTPGASDAMLNPFTNLSGSTTQLAWVLASAAQSVQAREMVERTGASPDYTIGSVAGDSSFSQLSPQVTITVSAADPEAAKAGAAALVGFMHDQLRSIQKDAGVAPNVYADLRTTTEPQAGTQVGSTALSNAGGLAMGAGLAGLLVSLLVVAGLEARRKRRPAAEAETPEENPLSGVAVGPADGVSTAPAAETGPVPPARLEIARPPADDEARPAAPRPARPAGRAQQRAMTRWRDHVEVISEESEFPLPTIDDDAEDGRRLGTSG
ncbi:hypothetical protein [Tsukamurella columbiensis]|uniref:Polysaccharide chain length determinant N-terminal domain-containing protein n=3 Tax=Tsukamurella TaxID=2060 RepID=A0A5C5RT31_9ACTN|nr:hypothetical protein [Tsukamurella columbiensis]NMD57012.1 hypothetical protein [Tsukamurella columbiensis]TWS25680.1 hypothetical protein FK530_22400 [Tsukamurella conjunctivitidis]